MEHTAVVQALLLLAMCSGVAAVNQGQCPTTDVNHSGGNCLEACGSDSSCQAHQKCCYNGCGHECTDVRPRAPTKAQGVCPRVEHDTFGICQDECSPSDDQCRDGTICCRNGCGHVCTTPVVEPTPEKDGRCPVVVDARGDVETCSVECTSDSECKSTKKCCSNGCGRGCVDPVKPDQRLCPNLDIIQDEAGGCLANCTSDEDCPGVQRCCSIGCSVICMDPIQPECPKTIEGDRCRENCSSNADCTGEQICCGTGWGHVCVDLARSIKPGQCPEVVGSFVGVCTEDCSSDGDCAGELKCCSNGCGHVCTRPGDEKPKPGHCSEVQDDAMGVCSEECSSDVNCTGEQKCCSNGCGHACQDPVWYACPHVPADSVGICTDTCKSDTDCAGNQMCCSNGCGHECIAPVLLTIRPSPSRQCPAVDGDTQVGICLEQCHSDADCTVASQRCCSTGCGHVCMDIVIKTTHNSGCRLGEDYYSDGDVVSTSQDCNTCICSSGEVVCRIKGNCKEEGTFTVAVPAPIFCGVAGIVISLLFMAVLVKFYVLRVVSSRRPYKMMYEVPEFEPIPRHML